MNLREKFERYIANVIPSRIHPNHLTAFRLSVIFLLPVATWYEISRQKIFWLVVIAGLSDALDGITARQRHQVTPLGSILDPVADKLFVAVCFIILWYWDLITPGLIKWMLILESHLIVIPILSFAWRLFGAHVEPKPYFVKPNFFGKLKMILLISGVSLMILGSTYDWANIIYTGRTIIYIGLIIGAMAFILYILDWFHNKY